MNVEETAKRLIEGKLPSKTYEELQTRRRERLDLWLDKGIKYIAESEMKLINEGEQVLQKLKEAGL